MTTQLLTSLAEANNLSDGDMEVWTMAIKAAVACPHCGAAVGKACLNDEKQYEIQEVHDERIQLVIDQELTLDLCFDEIEKRTFNVDTKDHYPWPPDPACTVGTKEIYDANVQIASAEFGVPNMLRAIADVCQDAADNAGNSEKSEWYADKAASILHILSGD